MLIDIDLLISYGAVIDETPSIETIFEEGETPKYYYQIVDGRVKLNHVDEDGKELIQSILTTGQSVCELLLFIDEKYPVNAVTLSETKLLRIPKINFFRLINENPDISQDINKFLSERLYQKFIMMQNNASLNPEVRLTGILKYFKSFSNDQSAFSFEVLLTRKQLASITGLRIETVIRTIKKMEAQNIVEIENRKIFY
ncbi:Crp/Fnr family transcriptional regulator [Chryseobacterium sp. GMJ5]|uniref:Crp/Fnr family transcriptional regulator n=1 Tax=Chryseobacterium gilvum TaxID=2976534 RepID=A0ABT2VX59_9FLAO|nr:Crp/Fnr family transcriptional regulator [Chryseobacterium gilvum]MCU7613502.1 Crp/Fnr family transcriptional regulator [Chryseobacterium gilvum]